VEDDLEDPGAIAEIDEDQAAVVAATMDPASDAHFRADVALPQLAAPAVAVPVRLRCLH
jgi:hypothetical protein